MARRGITKLICSKEKIINICPNGENVWKNTITFDRQNDHISRYWSMLQKDPSCIKDILLSFKDKLLLTKIIGFVSNKNTVYLKDMFDISKGYVAFIKNNNSHSLLVVGCKNVPEILMCGYTKSRESYCPLILSITDKIPAVINCL
ncbi:MAG: hypothetical protein M0R17_05130 [Candidatus Omnitrophica bacterium]|jgi:hypothetical protein|nr:hypothetical protein [Candidatus Omnitrophota bacterium]